MPAPPARASYGGEAPRNSTAPSRRARIAIGAGVAGGDRRVAWPRVPARHEGRTRAARAAPRRHRPTQGTRTRLDARGRGATYHDAELARGACGTGLVSRRRCLFVTGRARRERSGDEGRCGRRRCRRRSTCATCGGGRRARVVCQAV